MVEIQQIIDIVKAASANMVKSGFEVHNKSTKEDLVTSSDVAVQKELVRELSKLLPGSGFLCEEGDIEDINGHEAVWIIDPIDGTANYARGNQNCCISVGLVYKGNLHMGVVYSPWRNELYYAEKGKGAFCNGAPIHVSDRPFGKGLIFTAMSTYRKDLSAKCRDIIYDLYMECNDFRRTGSAAIELCLTAAGYGDLYFEIRLMPWDYAAALMILQEAGGHVCTLDGTFPSLTVPSLIIAANTDSNLHHLLTTIQHHLPQLPY